MFVVTVSFKNCQHQVVLRYKSEESMKAAIDKQVLDAIGRLWIAQDDFGTVASYLSEDVAHVCTQDLATSLKGRNAEDKIRARASQDLKQDMLNDPALEFIPERNPFFGRR